MTSTPAMHALMASAIDYAGMFPPAALDLERAVIGYARARGGPHAWMLGRFVLGKRWLPDFETLAATLRPFASRAWPGPDEGWPVSLIVTGAEPRWSETVEAFNARWGGRLRIASVETGALDDEQLDRLAAGTPHPVDLFVEVPLDVDCRTRVAAVAARHLGVKLRTGGATAGAFPTPTMLGAALYACVEARVPLKLTAGLHHAVRGPHPIDADPGAPLVEMHGFLTVMVAAAMAWRGEEVADVTGVLNETSLAAFRFTGDGLSWRDRAVTKDQILNARERFLRSFGSCSFEEPVNELVRAGLIA